MNSCGNIDSPPSNVSPRARAHHAVRTVAADQVLRRVTVSVLHRTCFAASPATPSSSWAKDDQLDAALDGRTPRRGEPVGEDAFGLVLRQAEVRVRQLAAVRPSRPDGSASPFTNTVWPCNQIPASDRLRDNALVLPDLHRAAVDADRLVGLGGGLRPLVDDAHGDAALRASSMAQVSPDGPATDHQHVDIAAGAVPGRGRRRGADRRRGCHRRHRRRSRRRVLRRQRVARAAMTARDAAAGRVARRELRRARGPRVLSWAVADLEHPPREFDRQPPGQRAALVGVRRILDPVDEVLLGSPIRRRCGKRSIPAP